MTGFTFLDPERDRGEWLEAWNRLRRQPELATPPAGFAGECPACCPDCGECWQYMGSAPYRGELAPTHYVHSFRHRCARGAMAPALRDTTAGATACGHRVNRNVLSSPGWAPAAEVAS